MPRRHRSARERESPTGPPERPRGVAPDWASTEDVKVMASAGERGKSYRCPGCNQEIRPGTPHLVVMEREEFEGRRHWHSPCWRRELKRRGLGS